MKTRDFYFDLPERLIAQTPSERRQESRLMVVDRNVGTLTHTSMQEFSSFIPQRAALVINNSKVRKARVYGTMENGTPVEALFLEEMTPGVWTILTNRTRRLKQGRTIAFPGGYSATVTESGEDGERTIEMLPIPDEDFFTAWGHVPLPPYIHRNDSVEDIDRYQTVYADRIGSVAAPTAGLHFTSSMLEELDSNGHRIIPVTLHVGAGTFLPVRTELASEHRMHYERYEIPETSASALRAAQRERAQILAVGTTSVRTLEAAADEEGRIASGYGRTNLFILPGFRFRVVDCLLTNFHTPESTLLMLVSAFAGRELMLHAYREAVEREYRFFSYGDAMLIL